MTHHESELYAGMNGQPRLIFGERRLIRISPCRRELIVRWYWFVGVMLCEEIPQ